MVDFVAVGLRGLSFAAALQAAGLPLFLWLFEEELEVSRRAVGRLGLYAAAVALATTFAYQLFEPARLAGQLAGVLDGSLQRTFLGSDAGAANSVRILGIVLILSGGLGGTRLRMGAGVIGGTLIVSSFSFVGHTAAGEAHWLLSSLLIVHLIVVAFWLGSLFPIYVVMRRETSEARSVLIARFSELAVRLVPVIFLAGLAMSIVLLPDLASLARPYGRLLLAKVLLFGILMGFAALNKWRLGPMLGSGGRRTDRAFKTSVLAEWGLIVAVVLTTAVMTGLYSPAH